jgi:amino-acid N-acetyltransferase
MTKRKLHLTRSPVIDQEDLDLLKAFLKENGLPFEDIRLEGNQFFLYLDGGTIGGCGGLEFYGDYCLLRSVAVAKEFRGEGYGKEIVQDLIARAADRRLWNISLLTETAESFFAKLGFKKQPREAAPDVIKTSTEFSSVCPVSAAFMMTVVAKKLEE